MSGFLCLFQLKLRSEGEGQIGKRPGEVPTPSTWWLVIW